MPHLCLFSPLVRNIPGLRDTAIFKVLSCQSLLNQRETSQEETSTFELIMDTDVTVLIPMLTTSDFRPRTSGEKIMLVKTSLFLWSGS